jgi:urease accessory protein
MNPVENDDSRAEYLILLLTDSNLPTGGFVASSGLESYHAHGLLKPGAEGLLQFIRLSLETYANQSAAFVLDTHRIVTTHIAEQLARDNLLQYIIRLDDCYHTLTLNHVAQRASKAQGIALLTLFTKSFSELSSIGTRVGQECSAVIAQIKSAIRADSCHGHLPICWAAFTACLGISAKRSLQVHLFLQVRAIISSAIRLNIVGPYLAHRLLAFNAKDIIDDTLKIVEKSSTRVPTLSQEVPQTLKAGDDGEGDEENGWTWTWPEDIESTPVNGHTPKMTWPLGDLVQARHDQLHSRLFNS